MDSIVVYTFRCMLLSVHRRCLVLLCLLAFCPASLFAQAAPAVPPASSTPLAEAQTDLNQGRNADAVAILTKLAAANPDMADVQHVLGLAYYRTGKLAEADRALKLAIAQDPNDIESVQLEGLTLFRMGHPKAAIPYLAKAKKWMPTANADASHVLGLCYLNSQQFDAARGAFAEEYGVVPDSAAAHLIMAQMLVLDSLPEMGAAEAQKALALHPDLPMAHFLIGEVDMFQSQVNQAIQQFQAEAAINPTYPPTYSRLGDAYLRLGDYDQAEQALLKSLALDTSRTGPFILMGRVLLRKQDPETAAMYLRHAEKMDPSNFRTHVLLGQALKKIGDDAEAQSEFSIAQKIASKENNTTRPHKTNP